MKQNFRSTWLRGCALRHKNSSSGGATEKWRAAAGLLFVAVLLATPVAGVCGKHSKTGGGEIRPAAIYHNYCSVCHGDKGDGHSRARASLVPPPKDFTNPAVQALLTRDYMIAIAREGKPGTAMVGWKTQLNDAEIEAVVDYIRTVFMQADADLARGRTIYGRTCAVCHGDRGQGAVWAGANVQKPPRAFTAPEAKAELTRERMIAAVTHGRPGTTMVSFASQLTPADIEAVVDYVRTAFIEAEVPEISGTHAHGGRQRDREQASPASQGKTAAAAPAAVSVTPDMSLPLPKGLVGNVKRGAKFYAANCATCHGIKGDGEGPRAYFIRPKPRNFRDPAARNMLNRPALFAAITAGKPGTEMPAWNKVIGDQQIADVAEYVFRSFVRPAPPPARTQ